MKRATNQTSLLVGPPREPAAPPPAPADPVVPARYPAPPWDPDLVATFDAAAFLRTLPVPIPWPRYPPPEPKGIHVEAKEAAPDPRRCPYCGHHNPPFKLDSKTTAADIANALHCAKGCPMHASHPDGPWVPVCPCGCTPPRETAPEAFARATATLHARGILP